MTYKEVLEGLVECALREPNIKFTGYKDIYELNSVPDINYSVFYITPNTFREEEDSITFSLNLYYVDR